jgi:hypothetical protein
MEISNNEKKYIALGFKKTFQEIGVPITYIPINESAPFQNKFGDFDVVWKENESIQTWGNISTNTFQDYSLKGSGRLSSEATISFLVSDFDTFSITPHMKDALDVTLHGEVIRYIIIGPDQGADWQEMIYAARCDTKEHINPG